MAARLRADVARHRWIRRTVPLGLAGAAGKEASADAWRRAGPEHQGELEAWAAETLGAPGASVDAIPAGRGGLAS